MRIIESGILSHGVASSDRANLTFPTLLPLTQGPLLATCRAGSTKDSTDERIELFQSTDGGWTWNEPIQPFAASNLNGKQGTLKICYLTELAPGHLLAASMWVDRATFPGQPLFNSETEGCLPMAILLADSFDSGDTWTAWRQVAMPADIGPPSLTNPVMKLADGTLVMSIETNKHYEDNSKWYQRVVLFHSTDLGQIWGEPITANQDPEARIFYWDQRAGVAPDGRMVTFTWTYDRKTSTYLNIHRRISLDGGHSWQQRVDLGITDQAAHPAILPDGRVVLAWVDRFKTQTIRARLADSVDGDFDPKSEVVVYQHETANAVVGQETGALLAEMSIWTFGLPYAEVLPNGEVMVVYYAGTEAAMDIHWARLQVG